MKRTTLLLTVILMFGLAALTGCGGGTASNGSADQGDAAQTAAVEDSFDYEGEWLETELLKVGVPAGWSYDVEDDNESGCSLQLLSTEEFISSDETIIMSIVAGQKANLGAYGPETLKEYTFMEVPASDKEGAVFETLDVGNLTFGKIEYTSSISGQNRLAYAYITGNIEYEVSDMTHCSYSCEVSAAGPYAEQLDLVDQVVKSIRLTIPSEFDDVLNARPVE